MALTATVMVVVVVMMMMVLMVMLVIPRLPAGHRGSLKGFPPGRLPPAGTVSEAHWRTSSGSEHSESWLIRH